MIPFKPYVRKKQVESILGTRENMTKNVFSLNNMIPHSVRLVDLLLGTMDQVLRLDLGLYFLSATLVTTSWSCFVPLGRH